MGDMTTRQGAMPPVPDVTKATPEQRLNVLLAMLPGQPEEALEEAIAAMPQWKESGEQPSEQPS